MLVEEVDKFLLHVLVNVTVAGECLASFLVATERTYKVWILDFLVEIADESAPGEVAAGNFIDWPLFLLASGGVEYCHQSVNSTDGENLLDSHIVFLRAD